MQKLSKLGVEHIILTFDAQSGKARVSYSPMFDRFANDENWEHGLPEFIKNIASSGVVKKSTTRSVPQLQDAKVAMNSAHVIRKHLSQKNLLKLLRAMSAANWRKRFLTTKSTEELAFEVDTYDGSKQNSNFDEIMADNAFKKPAGGDSSSSRVSGYQLLTIPVCSRGTFHCLLNRKQ